MVEGVADQRDHGDAGVLQVQDWLEQHHREAVNIGALGVRAAMSIRTLNRRFRAATGESPISYLHRVRIEAAKRLLDYHRFVGDVTLDRHVDGELVESVREDALWELLYFGARTRPNANQPPSRQPSAPIMVHRA